MKVKRIQLLLLITIVTNKRNPHLGLLMTTHGCPTFFTGEVHPAPILVYRRGIYAQRISISVVSMCVRFAEGKNNVVEMHCLAESKRMHLLAKAT